MKQHVTINFLDEQKVPCAEPFDNICLAGWSKTLPKRTRYLSYIPTKFTVDDPVGEKYFTFLKSLWHFRKMLWGLDYLAFKERGVLIDCNRWNGFQFYSLVVALRYYLEMKPLLNHWNNLRRFWNPFEAFVAAHMATLDEDNHWNPGHTLFSPNIQVVDGATPIEMESNFPKYDGVVLSEKACIFTTPSGNKWTLHGTFERPNKVIQEINWYTPPKFTNLDLKLFKQITPLKAEKVYKYAKKVNSNAANNSFRFYRSV